MRGEPVLSADGKPMRNAAGKIVVSDAIAPESVDGLFATSGIVAGVGYNMPPWFSGVSDFTGQWSAEQYYLYQNPATWNKWWNTASPLRLGLGVSYASGNYHMTEWWNFFKRVQFTMPAGLRGELTRAQLRIIARATLNDSLTDVPGCGLRVIVDESSAAYTLGADLLAAAGDVEVDFQTINAQTSTNGAGAVELRVELPVDKMNEFESDTFYVYLTLKPYSASIGDDYFPFLGDPASGGTNPAAYDVRAWPAGMKIGLV